MKTRLVVLVALTLLVGACYRTTVITGAPPAQNKVDLP
jgi:hypothetical protein